MIKKIILISGIILITAGFTGYNYISGVSSLNNVKIEFLDAVITEAKLSYFKLKLIVNISNPTETHISNLESKFDLFLSSYYIGEGDFSKINIYPKSHQRKDITIIVYYEGLASAVTEIIKDFISGKKVELTIYGTISGKVLFDFVTITKNFRAVF